jgi:DNA-directed RNA polymerase specialized sigma24 family protein
VAQTVFIDLARKAGSLPGDVGLAGWLHHHTCYTAATAVRTERRRQTREQTDMEMRALDDNTRPEWEEVAPYQGECQSPVRGWRGEIAERQATRRGVGSGARKPAGRKPLPCLEQAGGARGKAGAWALRGAAPG